MARLSPTLDKVEACVAYVVLVGLWECGMARACSVPWMGFLGPD